MDFETLLKGGSITKKIDEQIVFSQMDENEESIWSLLLASGYLKVLSYKIIYGSRECELALTNLEVKVMFQTLVSGWFGSQSSNYNDFIKSMLQGNVKEMNAYMNRVALGTFSSFDTGTHPSGSEPERFYHGFVLGLLVDLRDRYEVLSNRESGLGRYDVLLEPKNDEDDAIILEFKVQAPDEEKDLKETVESALKQIEDKKYKQSLMEKGFSENRIRQYGFAFEGKRVLIG